MNECIEHINSPFQVISATAMESYLKEAEDNYTLRKYDSSLKILKKVIYEEPHNSLAKLKMGMTYQALGDYSEALKCFDEVIACDQYNAEAWYNKGLLQNRMGSYKEGLSNIARSFNIHQNSDYLNCVSSPILAADEYTWKNWAEKDFLFCVAPR